MAFDRKRWEASYREKNRERLKKYARRWRANNKMRVRKYHENNRERRRKNYQDWKKRNPDRYYESQRKSWIKRKYGLSWSEYQKLLLGQNGKCDLCSLTFSETADIQVDHDHRTGKVRGLLHGKCNRLLSNAEDNIAQLENAIKYLQAKLTVKSVI